MLVQVKVWLKPGGEQQFLYGNHVLKSAVARITETAAINDGAVVFAMNNMPIVSFHSLPCHEGCEESDGQGFGILAKDAGGVKRADPTAVVVLHQADVGQYLRSEATLT